MVKFFGGFGMTELILSNFFYGFCFCLFFYFTGYVVRLIDIFTKWR